MKKSLFVLILGLVIASCDTTVKTSEDSTQFWRGNSIEVIVYDSCEYVLFSNGQSSWGAHKGNCKYCAERNKN